MSKPVLMCVDDEAMILLSLKDQLRAHFAEDFRIEVIESGDEALEVARALLDEDVDIPVVVCDQIMPGMRGNELLRHIHVLSPRTFNVLLTGQADAGAVGEAVNSANLYRYIAKPWEETDLVLTIKEAIRGYFQDKKLEEQNRALKEMNENLEQLVADRTREVVRQRDEIQRQMLSIETQRRELEVRNNFIRRVFGRYVSDDVMIRLLEDPEGLSFRGEKRDITVLLSDLRGFTALTARYDPETIVRILNRYFERMVDIITAHNGIIIEFLGDGVMAVFGAPRRLAQHADHAVACALRMQNAMADINTLHAAEGLPALEMGTGITSGEVVIGNIGSEQRAKYGIVGTPANLAARIEALSTGQQILISSDTLDRCVGTLRTGNAFQAVLKGVIEPVRIQEVTGIEGTFSVNFDAQREAPLPLEAGVRVTLAALDGKSISEVRIAAEVLAVSRSEARVLPERPLIVHGDVRISLLEFRDRSIEADVYAKVLAQEGGNYLLRFTSIFTSESEGILNELLECRITQD